MNFTNRPAIEDPRGIPMDDDYAADWTLSVFSADEKARRLTVLEDYAAELTSAVYPTLLRLGMANLWLDIELSLWKELSETIKNKQMHL